MAITVEYEGELRCKAVHESSGTVLITDAPKDHHGRGEGFSPSDPLSVSLGSCILSVMGITARQLNVDISGATVSVDKKMGNAPRAIVQIDANVEMPELFDSDIRLALEKAAHSCPVHEALHPDINSAIKISWPSAEPLCA
jgi:putative redox protein